MLIRSKEIRDVGGGEGEINDADRTGIEDSFSKNL